MKRLMPVAVLFALVALSDSARAADTYKADPVHSSVLFRVHHGGAGYVWGRFNDPAGTLVLDDADPTKDAFTVEITVANIDTHNDKRDGHLKSPDFFNAKQYPVIAFKSTSVKKGQGNMLEVTGDLTMHGVTKSITVNVELTGKAEVPPGTPRAGVEATFAVKAADYEFKLAGAIPDEIKVIVSLEGIKQ